jgi:hypothetical protein
MTASATSLRDAMARLRKPHHFIVRTEAAPRRRVTLETEGEVARAPYEQSSRRTRLARHRAALRNRFDTKGASAVEIALDEPDLRRER